MNEKEWRIISHLRKDSKVRLATISSKEVMPISTVHDKINRLERNGLIEKYTIILDFKKFGFMAKNKIALKVLKSQKNSLMNYLQEQKCVNSIYEIDGGFDFFFETVHKDIKEYLEFIDLLKEHFEILELHKYEVINDIQKEKFCF